MFISTESARLAGNKLSRSHFAPAEDGTIGYLGFVLHRANNSVSGVVKIVHDAATADAARMEAAARAVIPDDEALLCAKLASTFCLGILSGEDHAAVACASVLHKNKGFPTGMLLGATLTDEDTIDLTKPFTLACGFERTVEEEYIALNAIIHQLLREDE
ncbi:hypothetical protein [Microvirga aerophila]|uniref:Uncharacterized protein n=1 Tax=Microvirga aerophila TaxID=670291 RepID=A0A512BVP0_9HYPH|nr:hypothetical protein [Microvirga aerophila]GEO16013.1 hypothetical protein MAE02_37090 [Microvirga aerophila]